MPAKRRVAKVSLRRDLTIDQYNELWLGPKGKDQSAFANERERRAAWKEHREQFLEHFGEQFPQLWAVRKYDLKEAS